MPLIITVLVAFLTSFSMWVGDGVWVGVWGEGVTHKCSYLICLKKQKGSEQNRHVIARTFVCLSICSTNAKIFGYGTQNVNFLAFGIYYVLVNYTDIIFFIKSASGSHHMHSDNMQTGYCCNKSIGNRQPKHKSPHKGWFQENKSGRNGV